MTKKIYFVVHVKVSYNSTSHCPNVKFRWTSPTGVSAWCDHDRKNIHVKFTWKHFTSNSHEFYVKIFTISIAPIFYRCIYVILPKCNNMKTVCLYQSCSEYQKNCQIQIILYLHLFFEDVLIFKGAE